MIHRVQHASVDISYEKPTNVVQKYFGMEGRYDVTSPWVWEPFPENSARLYWPAASWESKYCQSGLPEDKYYPTLSKWELCLEYTVKDKHKSPGVNSCQKARSATILWSKHWWRWNARRRVKIHSSKGCKFPQAIVPEHHVPHIYIV